MESIHPAVGVASVGVWGPHAYGLTGAADVKPKEAGRWSMATDQRDRSCCSYIVGCEVADSHTPRALLPTANLAHLAALGK